MTDPISNLRLLERSSTTKELNLVSELFHQINRIIPEDQSVLTIPPSCLVRDAVALMCEKGYSQIPVVDNEVVLGVFSFRSFARNAAGVTLEEWTKQKCAPGDLRVDEFLEEFQYFRVTEELGRVIHAMEVDNGALVGIPERLMGVITPMDFVRYLHRVASPFVMVSEIELALRALIHQAFPDKDRLAEIAKRCLSSAYGREDKVPTSLEAMTFDNYQSLVAHGDAWTVLELVLGGTRTRASAKLKEVGEIRNALFHFKREISLHDHETLAACRNWLLSKTKQMELHRKMEVRP